jgi:signal recognition particle subunit SEC65
MPTRKRGGVPEFSKQNVLEALAELEVPTVTDKQHRADWWNETFGRLIKHSFDSTIKTAKDKIEAMWEIGRG